MNTSLLAENKFMPGMHLRQTWFLWGACGPFIKNKERIKRFKETGNWIYAYQKELVKACFQHGIAYGDFKNLARRTASDKVLCDKVFNVAKNSKYVAYQRGLASMVYNFFDKKTSSGTVKNKNISNEQLA